MNINTEIQGVKFNLDQVLDIARAMVRDHEEGGVDIGIGDGRLNFEAHSDSATVFMGDGNGNGRQVELDHDDLLFTYALLGAVIGEQAILRKEAEEINVEKAKNEEQTS